MKEGGTSLNKTFREYNLVFKGLNSVHLHNYLAEIYLNTHDVDTKLEPTDLNSYL